MKPAKAIRLALGIASLVAAAQASAMLLPVTDYANLAYKKYQELQDQLNAMVNTEYLSTIFEMTGLESGNKIDTINNGVANAVARINQVGTDLHNLTQLERSQPSRDACSATFSSDAFEKALCNQGSVQEDRDGLIAKVSNGVSDLYASVTAGAGAVTGLSINDSTSSAKLTLSQKAYAAYQKEQVAQFERYQAWVDAGKGAQATNPNLLMPMGNYNPQLTDEEIEMAKTYAFATYPPYVRKNIADPTSTNEIEAELRLKNTQNLVGAVINRQIELRVPPEPGQPSKLTTLEAQTALRFTDDGKLASDGNSWLQRTTQGGSYSTHAISRDGAIMKSIKIKQMIDRYESSLVRERLLASYVLNALNDPASKIR